MGRIINNKKRHPAASARILATGLSATAVLGLTSAYAIAAPSYDSSVTSTTVLPSGSTEPIVTIPQLGDTSTTVAPQQPNLGSVPVTTTPQRNRPRAANPSTTQAPVVISVPPPPAPPSNGGNSGSGSRSNGS